MKDKTEIILEVRSMLADVFAAEASGEVYERLARAHGYVDGYMRALIELGVVGKDELLELVTLERERCSRRAPSTERSAPAMHVQGTLATYGTA
jgi:hypothetical protein